MTARPPGAGDSRAAGAGSASHGLRADLKPLDVLLLVMGGIIGAGIFFSPHLVAKEQPSAAGILLTWGLGGLLALTGAFVFAELGALFPRTGGQYVYLRESCGKSVAFLYGWNLLAMVASGALAVVAGVAVSNLDIVLRHTLGDPAREFFSREGRALSGAGLILGCAWLNVRGIRLGATVHNAIMAFKVLSLLLVIVLGIVWSFRRPEAPPAGFFAAGPRLESLAPALLAALFSYGGWQNAASVAGEIRDAPRVLPRAIILGTLLVVGLYLGLNLALLEVLGVEGLSSTQTPVADAAERVLGRFGHVLVASMIVLSTVGIAHALILMTPRVYYAMAADGVFFEACGRSHPKNGTPHVAILVQAAFGLAHYLVATYVTTLGELLDSLVFVDWVFFALTAASYFYFRLRRPDAPRPYRATGHPWTPLVFLTLSLGVVVFTLAGVSRRRLLVAGIVFATGLLLLLFRRRRARHAPEPPPAA
ncbi:MAG TPA: amino acid permease [Planctomycetota bacterium]|nr:amino acid permease [Planctomycetota bacterium]